MKTFRHLSILTAGAALLAVGSVSLAQTEVDPTVKARQSQMQLIAYHTGILGAIAKGEAEYDATVAQRAASNLNAVAMLAPEPMWREGTAQGEAEGTYAKPEVWSDAAGFAEKLEGLRQASAEMIDAAGTDLETLRAGMGKLGGACKACHETYRVPKN